MEEEIVKTVSIELTSDELAELTSVLLLNISEEAEILHRVAENQSRDSFYSFLASINRKAELYKKLRKALNNRFLI